MSPIMLTVMIFSIMLALMVIRVPIAVTMFVAGSVGYLVQTGWIPYANFLNGQAFARFASYDLSVIPLFILMGHFATQGGISKALFSFAAGVTGRLRGGLAMGAVLACAVFGAICGSSVATAATITNVAYEEMRRHGYSGRLATGTLAAGGTLGILIPPSVPLVIYAILAEQNIAKLFAAAMIPGLIAMCGYMIAIAVYVRLVPGHAPEHDVVDTADLGLALRGVLPIVAIFTVVFGGIYGGAFTPTEGAAVGAASTFVAALLKGELTPQKTAQSFLATAESSALIFLIFLGADVMNAALALTQVPNQLAQVIGGWGLPPLAIVGAILLFYVLLGAVMDELSMILLTLPIFFPLVISLDLGMSREHTAIWFGIMVLMTVGFGLLAPPVGLNVYVVNGIVRHRLQPVPIRESYHGVMPFLLSDVVRTLLLLFFPGISLWLVGFI
ncbi:MAG: TRAP transporter large permease [Betaproteobacteria bacterium]|nr:TRAP transporter large permease [Betaproteobacteria bacterium]